MKQIITTVILLFTVLCASAQGTVKGMVLDKNNSEALGFVTVALTPKGSSTITAGTTTDIDGNFHIQNVKYGTYTLTLSFVGYKTVTREFTLSKDNRTKTYPALYMSEDPHVLNEVHVTGQRSTMRLEVDRKVFDVASNVANIGQTASEVLDNIPSVEVDNDGNVSLRGNSSVEVWINGRSAGLTSDNMGQVLQQIPSETIDHIEVLDNPSAKFSAEGSAGIINIVLKKDRKAGYYGSLQAGCDTRGGANTGFNFNYSSKKIDFFINLGYRHRENEGHNVSDQLYTKTNRFSRYDTHNSQMGNNLFTRGGVTLHLTSKDDIALTGMFMHGKHKSWETTPYTYGTIVNGVDVLDSTLLRSTTNNGPMNMYDIDLNYRHSFTETHFIDFTVNTNRWKSDMDDIYRDNVYDTSNKTLRQGYQYRPMHINNREYEIKIEYENKISDKFKLEAGYNGDFSKENTPNESYEDNTWDGINATEDKSYYNRFIYRSNTHAGYVTTNFTFDNFGLMAGLRGEYWNVDTESRNWDQEYNGKSVTPYKKNFFQLFPSVFMSYQLTKDDQLQLNYTRRLRRPWGGELNSFRNTSDASIVEFGNPELTPEYSNSFSLNYLRTWEQHSLLVSAYYRPTTDVIQHVNYQGVDGSTMYSTSMNVAKSQSEGIELTGKNKLFSFLELTTNVNAYYYKLNGFTHDVQIDAEGNPVSSDLAVGKQTIAGDSRESFTWNARMTASFKLPYDISIQTTGRYSSREVISQGSRPASYMVDLGVKKNFFNRLFTLSINCRDLLNSRKWESNTEGEGYTRYQLHKRGGRKVNFTLTWNFGNNSNNKKKDHDGKHDDGDDDSFSNNSGYEM